MFDLISLLFILADICHNGLFQKKTLNTVYSPSNKSILFPANFGAKY